MSELTLWGRLGLLVWGTLTALDLVSVPQAMLSRPLVAGVVGGWVAGDLEAGARIGVVMDFHELDRQVEEIVGWWHNRHLNEAAEFKELNPSTENVAARPVCVWPPSRRR